MSYVDVNIGKIPEEKLKGVVRNGKITLTKEMLAGSSNSVSLHPDTAKKVINAKNGKRGTRVTILEPEIRYSMKKHPTKSAWRGVWEYAEKKFAAKAKKEKD